MPIPLSTFSHFKTVLNSLTVNHQGPFPSITLSFALAPRTALSDAVDVVNEAREEIGMPANVTAKFAGTAQVFQASLKNQPLLILAALLAVYVVLGILYESYVHPSYYSFNAAFRRRRCATRSDVVPCGADRHRHDRHHFADRHRKE
jgi:multidrug efflux pump subunit AcrB